MDEDYLTSSFFEFYEEVEDQFSFPISFEDVRRSVLTFLLDSKCVKLDLSTLTIECKSSDSITTGWISTAQHFLSSQSQAILNRELSIKDLLKTLVAEYDDHKSYQEDEFSDEDADAHQIDYRREVLEAERNEQFQQSRLSGNKAGGMSEIGDIARTHFIFRQADEARQLLSETIASNPGLMYSCNIDSCPELANIRIDIDLSFLDISEQSMNMLGLTFEYPLTVSVLVNEQMILQTFNMQDWTPTMLGIMSFEVLQNSNMDSYGCREYLKGRINKFRELVHRRISEGSNLPPLINLSRENSVDSPYARSPTSDRLISQLTDMGYSRKEAMEALLMSNSNIEEAIEIINNGSLREFSNEGTRFILNTNNFFYNLLFYLRDRLENCTNYCFICYKRHPVDSIRLRSCSQEICEFRFEEISGVSVFGELINNFEACHLDLSFAAEALFSTRSWNVFEPFPSFMLKQKQIRGKSGFLERGKSYSKDMDSNKDIDSLRRIFLSIPHPDLLIKSSTDEISLKRFLYTSAPNNSEYCYKLIRYVLATNRLALVKLSNQNCIGKLPSYFRQYLVTNQSPETESYFARQKKKHGSFFAFHGSAIENWYSILRNGIRNLSNTHLMTAGAAHGVGVYAAENIMTSLGYCRFSSQGEWGFSMLHNPPMNCMALVEIINKSNYSKGSNIYVVSNDRDLIIRYLLIFTTNEGASNDINAKSLPLEEHYKKNHDIFKRQSEIAKQIRIQKAIEKYRAREHHSQAASKFFPQAPIPVPREEEKFDPSLEDKLKKIESAFSGSGSATANKRILQEYKYLLHSKECKGISVDFENGHNMYVWIVSLDIKSFEVNKELKTDFENYARRYNRAESMVFEVRFDSNFPFSPPFVRLVRPRFEFRTGHITIGGSICMQSLTPSGWIPVRTVESIFIEILFNMAEGGAKIDSRSPNSDYTLAEAQEAFNRVARQHNWL
jgi:ubiquitin-protein ligase